MLRKLKNWFKGLAGVPALEKELATQQLKFSELEAVLKRERAEHKFEREATLATKVRVAIRRKEITHREAENIITLLKEVPAPRATFKIERAKKPAINETPKRTGLSSTGR